MRNKRISNQKKICNYLEIKLHSVCSGWVKEEMKTRIPGYFESNKGGIDGGGVNGSPTNLPHPRTNLESQPNCGEITQNKQLNNT